MNNWMLRKSPKPGLYVQRSLTWLKVEQAQIIDDFEKTEKLIEDIKFDFMINNKHVSVARFKVELKNKSIIEVIGYDEIADLCYQKLKPQMKAYIQGKVTTKLAVEIENIYFNE